MKDIGFRIAVLGDDRQQNDQGNREAPYYHTEKPNSERVHFFISPNHQRKMNGPKPYNTNLLMSSLFRDHMAVRPRGEPFQSRSMGLCLAGHRPVLSMGEKIPSVRA